MTIDRTAALSMRTERRIRWSRRDAALYALGVSVLDDPLDDRQIRLARADQGFVLPSFAAALARNTAFSVGDLGGDYAMSLLVGQAVTMHRPFPPEGEAILSSDVVSLQDRGAGRGLLVGVRTSFADPADGGLIATVLATLLARSDGGCGSGGQPLSDPAPIPARPADHIVDLPTRPDQAWLYRLSGDENPLHVDPAAAAQRGFARPILHGLCSFAFAARAVLSTYADLDPSRLSRHEARFAGPVYPGETLRVSLWRDDDAIAFEVHAADRNAIILGNGRSLVV